MGTLSCRIWIFFQKTVPGKIPSNYEVASVNISSTEMKASPTMLMLSTKSQKSLQLMEPKKAIS
jgi:hypothetical protein